MKELFLEVREFNPELGRELGERGFISFIHHPDNPIRSTLEDNFLKGKDFPADKHGFYSVTIIYTEIFLSSHPEGI